MEIDWNVLQKEASTAGLLPVGDYPIIVTEASAVTSSTGKPMIKVKCRVTDGPQKDKPIWNQFVVSPESGIALRIFFNHMNAFGLGPDFFAGGPSMDVVAQNLLNRTAIFELGVRAWQGTDRNEVKSVKPPLAGGPVAPGVVTGAPVAGLSAGAPPVPTAASTSAPPVPATPSTAPTPPTPMAPPTPMTPPVPPAF